MADHPDSDSSPKASNSSDSNSSDEEEKRIGAIRTPAHTDEDPSAYADPESPSTGQQSSDESGSSDGVLVELPTNPDQESRGLRGDRDSGILVNIDGSMQEPPDEGDRGEDAGKEETFEDASDQLGMVSGRSSGLEESMAVIEMEDSAGERLVADDLARVRTRLEDTMAECRKYKEESEVFRRQVIALRQQIQDMIDKQSVRAENNAELVGHLCRMDTAEGEEDKVLSSPTPLHRMLGDCSKFMHHLKGILGEQSNSDDKIRELRSVLYSKDQKLEDLNAKASEISVSRDVILSYLDSLREAWSVSLKESSDDVSKRLLASLASVAGQQHGSLEDPTTDGMSLVERNTLLLIEKHVQFLSEIQLLGQCLAEIRPDFANSQENESGIVFSIAREELLEGKRKESCLQERMFKLEDENRELAEQVKKMKESLEEANADTSKIKMELEQTENRLVASREKLSIAVTKGKSLVQHRDSLKQSLAEKTSELERCMQELQQKSDALQASEASTSKLKQLVAEKTSELEESMQESQQKSDAFQASEASANELKQLLDEKVSELEGFMLVLQQKSNALQATEASADELKQLLVDRTSELERCVQELQQKSDVLRTIEATAEELKQLLAKNKSELEHCLTELQQKSDALQTTEAIAKELKQLLDGKTSELEMCLVEMQKKSDALETAKASIEELNETNILVSSLRESLSQRDVILQEIEEIMSTNSTQGLHSMEVIDRVRWFVNQKNVADIIFLENRKAKDALSFIELPETISSSELFSQINWLVNSFSQAKDDIVKLQEEIASNQLAVASHESELSETHKEIDCLAKSLLEEKQTKESLQNEHEYLRCKYEGIAEKLSVLSSEKDGLMKVLLQISESTMDDQPAVVVNVLIEKCMAKIRERIKISLAESEQIERMQTLLFVSSQELKLCEMILEEDLIERSTMMRLSDELGRASEEVVVLKNDKDSLQKELEQAEEKSSLLREKLSMAVKKGKGLVQEHEGFKHSLDEKNSEIEKLKYDLQLKDSAINDYQEQIKSLSGSPELIQKLESDIASLKDQRDQSEQILHESNSTLQRLVDSIENIVLPTDNIFEGPIEKLNWTSEHIKELQLAKAHAEEELHKAKEESTLHASRLADASTTIKSIEDRLADAEKCLSFITEEKKDMQHGKASIEQELEKMREEGSMQASKLADAYATIRSLEDELLQAERNISLLDAGKSEAETKSKEEIIALNAKLAECMEELAGTRGSLENYVAQMNSHFGHLQILMKDEGLLSLMTEEFRKKFESLRNMGLLIHNMHEQFAEKGLHLHPDLEHDHEFAKLLSLPKFEDFLNNRMLHNETSTPDLGDISSLTSIIEGLHAQAKLLSVGFGDLSKYMDDHIALILQGLQATRDVFIHMVGLSESLKADVDKLEAHNQAQEAKVVSLQKEMTALFSACVGATQELQIEFHDLMNSESNTEQDIMNSSLHLRSREAVSSGVEDMYADEYAKAADDLLRAARRVKIQCQQLANIKEVSVASMDDMEDRLKQAELTAETAIQDRHLNQEKVSIMERDLEALQEICSEMKSKIENYQAREDMLRYKEEEFLSLQHTLTAKERGIGDQLFSQDQLETLIYKIDDIEIPFNELETQSQEFHFSSPVEKLFYIIDKFSELLHRLDTLTNEKEDMQLILASHVRELEQLRQAAEAIDTDYQELESKKSELFELTVGLEKIIHRMGGNDSIEDQKPKAKSLVTVLERLAIASSTESENSKTRIRELGTKLQEKERVVDELSTRIKMLKESIHSQLAQPDTIKERTVFEESPAAIGSEISEIDDVGPMGKNSIVPTAAHVRTMRKGSTDHIVLSIDSESDRLTAAQETDDKGHIFKSLNTSGLIPKQGKLIADRVDGIWVSGGRILMSRPGARLGLIAYWIFLHLWLLGTIL